MSSKRRIDASRRNGALSAGPRTDEGRRRSSRNNLRHGILAQTVVLEDEDKNVFIEFVATLEDEHQPIDQTERDLVETMAVARWRIMRLWAMEKANLQEEINQDQTPGRDHPTRAALAFRKLCDQSRSADLLGRYETRYDRQYYRALNLLLKKRAPASPVPPGSPPKTNLPFEPNPTTEHAPQHPPASPSTVQTPPGFKATSDGRCDILTGYSLGTVQVDRARGMHINHGDHNESKRTTEFDKGKGRAAV